MEYRRLGKSGLKLSALSLGSWVTFKYQVDDRLAVDLMKAAYDAGVNFFDNAEAYAQGDSERIMGRALKKLGWGRDTYCVSSKVFWGGKLPTQKGLSRKHVHDACHAALERLQVDYLDLFFCHRADIETPIEETVRAMNDLIAQGKVLYWGTSEWSADKIAEAHGVRARCTSRSDDGPAAVQHVRARQGRARVRAPVRRARHRHHDLVAARLGHPDRQVRQGRAARVAHGAPGLPVAAQADGEPRRPEQVAKAASSRRWRPISAARWPSSPSPGAWSTRTSRRSSWGPRRCRS
jgi:aryl-alcohol dehydrogenase-like predicted oxidoreductase